MLTGLKEMMTGGKYGVLLLGFAMVYALLPGAEVRNVVAKQGIGSNDVHIYYDIIDERESSWQVSVRIMGTEGELQLSAQALAGDVEKTVVSGVKKHVIWHADRDYSELWGDGFFVEVLATRCRGDLIIRGNDGTEVYVDGKWAGRIKKGKLVVAGLDAAEHKVEAKREGRHDYSQEIKIRTGVNEMRLPGVATGDLLVKAPEDMCVFVDGVSRGKIRGGKLELRDLVVGDYEVILAEDGVARDVKLRYSIEIKPNERAMVDAAARDPDSRRTSALAQGKGILSGTVRHYRPGTNITEAYVDARVELYYDGKKTERTIADKAGVFRFVRLATGSYDLKVYVPTAYPNEEAQGIKVVDGRETSRVRVLIEQEFIPGELNLFFHEGTDERTARKIIGKHGLVFEKKDIERNCYLVSMSKERYIPEVVKQMEREQVIKEAIPNYYVFYKK